MFLLGIIFISATLGDKIYESNGINITAVSGDFPHPAVIGGYEVTIDELPYAARLYIFANHKLIFCTGEIVHSRLVLTAAHCVEHGGTMLVVTGNADHDDYVRGINTNKYARYQVIQTFIHPKFNRYEYVHDVALAKLGRPMIHPHKILPISYEPLKSTMPAIIYGWGATEKNQRNNRLFAKNLSVKTCTLRSNSYQYICLVGPGICHGDSGGALIVNGSLLGVASFFETGHLSSYCGADRYYYMSMWEEKDFLENAIRANGANYNRCFLFLSIMSFIFIF